MSQQEEAAQSPKHSQHSPGVCEANNHESRFNPQVDVPSRRSISERRTSRSESQPNNVRRRPALDLAIRVPSRKQDSFRVTDTSYTRDNLRIDNRGIVSQANNDDEQKVSETPHIQSFIRDISEVVDIDVIGHGQSGYVSQAIHVPSQKMLAIKTISVDERGARSQIMNEFKALVDTNCNGLVDFYGIFFSKRSVLIALEYCECGSLCDVLQKVDKIPEAILAKMCTNILDGLDFLHTEKKWIHRDLKPSNICLNARGDAKLSDFGISRELKDSIVKCQSYVGTMSYMSPERIRGDAYSYSSDIWGLGLSLMQCAMGRFPFPQTNQAIAMIQWIMSDQSPTLPQDMEFSKEFEDFINQCLLKDPTKRPTAKELKTHAWIEKHKQVECAVSQWIQENELVIHVPSIQHIIDSLNQKRCVSMATANANTTANDDASD